MHTGVRRGGTLDYSRHEQFPGNARREFQFMDELARQYGMGQDPNRIEIPHTVGASADQFVYVGSGQAPPPPGTHHMSDGRVMANEGQTGGTHACARVSQSTCGDST